MSRSFDDLVAEAATAPVDGWDFSWLDGRATEQRPSWRYQRLMSQRLAAASAGLDLQTGGGEVLAGAEAFPPAMAATESWPPNAARATRLLHPRGVVVVATPDHPPLPFADGAFDLVTSRHPIVVWWSEIARVLKPGGSYLAQHIGPGTVGELADYFDAPPPARHAASDVAGQVAEAKAAGLQPADARMERLRVEFFDVGSVIYFLRKVIWIVPGFTADGYLDRLRALHDLIETDGPFVAHATRVLIDAKKPER
ncbi:MAG: class I SAM-dependent methyltransferase [Mycobacterium sp.]